MTVTTLLTPSPAEIAPRPALDATPRPGESITGAIFRLYDPHYGDGVQDTDATVYAQQERADLLTQIASLTRNNSYYQRRVIALSTEVTEAYELIARQRDELAEANAYIVSLQDQLAATGGGH